jgi:hypothetical protein
VRTGAMSRRDWMGYGPEFNLRCRAGRLLRAALQAASPMLWRRCAARRVPGTDRRGEFGAFSRLLEHRRC